MTDYTDLIARLMEAAEEIGDEDFASAAAAIAALTAERDALRVAIINRLHHYEEATGEDRCGCGACEPLFAALTATTTSY